MPIPGPRSIRTEHLSGHRCCGKCRRPGIRIVDGEYCSFPSVEASTDALVDDHQANAAEGTQGIVLEQVKRYVYRLLVDLEAWVVCPMLNP